MTWLQQCPPVDFNRFNRVSTARNVLITAVPRGWFQPLQPHFNRIQEGFNRWKV